MKEETKARERSHRAVELLGSAIDFKVDELTESNRQLKRKIFDLYTIFEISRNFNSVLNYETLVDSFILTSLGQVVSSTAALYLLPEEGGDKIVLVKSKGLTHDEVPSEFERTGRLADYLLAMSKPIKTAELTKRFALTDDSKLLVLFPHGLAIPLIIKSQLKGILFLGGKVSGAEFANDDIEFLSILANQFVVALDNARLYESEKLALDELKNAQKQLVLRERQAAIGELSAKIAHEVNNPLSIISNYLHLCDRTLNDPGKSREYLEVVHQELSRIAGIVRQLLDFHRPIKAEKAPVRVDVIIDEVLGLVERHLAEKKIVLVRKFAEFVPMIDGSPEQLKQVFLNLIINARDFMPEGGQLILEIKDMGKTIEVVFSDTGPGIPEEALPKLFEPFFTTREDNSGTGLGLAVCYGIISEHGGRIDAGNVPEGGARFVITLPVSAKEVR